MTTDHKAALSKMVEVASTIERDANTDEARLAGLVLAIDAWIANAEMDLDTGLAEIVRNAREFISADADAGNFADLILWIGAGGAVASYSLQGCDCPKSDAWLCAKVRSLSRVACTCKCHRYVHDGLSWEQARREQKDAIRWRKLEEGEGAGLAADQL